MTAQSGSLFETIDRVELERKMAAETPQNDDPAEGWALVNVLGHEAFEAGHIDHSINIPVGRIERFEDRFAKSKEIVVYCASPECDASPKVAGALARRGFTNVKEYAGGLTEWEGSGHPVVEGSG